MDAKLNHSDLTALLAKKVKMSGAKADAFTKAFFDIIIEGLDNDGLVKINGLGTFKVTDVASRGSVNVNTGEKIEIKGHKKLTFLPAEILKEKVNKPFAMFEPVEIDDTYVDDAEETSTEEVEENAVEESVETVKIQSENLQITEVIAESTEEENKSAAETKVVQPAESPTAEETSKPTEEETENKAAKTENEIVTEIAQPLTEEVEETMPAQEGTPVANVEIAPVETDQPVVTTKTHCVLTILAIFAAVIVIALLAIMVPSLVVVLTGDNITPVVVEKTEEVAPVKVAEPVEVQEVVEVPEDTVQVMTVPAEEEVYCFELVEELANKRVGDINRGDTLLYKAEGSIETHKVAEHETLTRIAFKYYGDKRLWPYIVQYNKLTNPNGLCKGMEIEIPRLVPMK